MSSLNGGPGGQGSTVAYITLLPAAPPGCRSGGSRPLESVWRRGEPRTQKSKGVHIHSADWTSSRSRVSNPFPVRRDLTSFSRSSRVCPDKTFDPTLPQIFLITSFVASMTRKISKILYHSPFSVWLGRQKSFRLSPRCRRDRESFVWRPFTF